MYTLKTKYGKVKFEATSKGICKIFLGDKSNRRAINKKIADQNLLRFVLQLNNYFAGNKVNFDVKFDITHLSDFTKKVLKETKKIQHGEISTYGEIAKRIGCPNASRAVGQALGANPLPILIPCHRVIRKDNSLGGFAFGLKWKKMLLDLESKK
jgi:methylated-DNA-[protein]-cysteine S-methyltransferase